MIKIITVYNTLNPGSLLQATSLYNFLSYNYNGKVSFLKLKSRHPLLSGIKLSCKLLLKFKFKAAIKQLIMPFKYLRILKKYSISSKKIDGDIYIIGSDEIWNISRKNIVNNNIFWGVGVNQSNCISYAPSINNAKISDFEKYPYINESLSKFYAISVRDTYSKNTLQLLTNNNISIVCDPTLLLSKHDYEKLEEKNNFANYIFVYGAPSRFTSQKIEEIRQFASKENKKIISYYFNNDWCDEVVYGSPYYFLALISKADYVITNTFHGTIFSLIYNKKFAVIGENQKVKEIISQFELDGIVNMSSIETILSKSLDYKKINTKIEDLKKRSKEFLICNIDNLLKKINNS